MLFSTNLVTHAFEAIEATIGTGSEMEFEDSEVRDASFYKVSIEY